MSYLFKSIGSRIYRFQCTNAPCSVEAVRIVSKTPNPMCVYHLNMIYIRSRLPSCRCLHMQINGSILAAAAECVDS